MPFKFVLNSTATIFLGVCIGYFGMHFAQKSKWLGQESSNFSSLSPDHPIAKLGADQISRDYFTVQFNSNEVSAKNDSLSKVKVKIAALKDIPEGLQFNWILGSDMTTTDALEGSLTAMQAGEEKIFELSVLGFSKEAVSHVSFLISGNLGTHPVKREIIASSRPEDSYEYVVQQQALYESQFQAKASGLKMRKGASKGLKDQFDPSKIVR